jgi:phage I-like protein
MARPRTVKDVRPDGVELIGFLHDTHELTEALGSDRQGWLMAFPFGNYLHPRYGEIDLTTEKLTQMRDNFEAGVRGQDVPLDYQHGEDPAKGGRAAGWVLAMDLKEDGLYWHVQMTPTALQEIRDGEWRYFSPEYAEEWQEPRSRNTFNNVVFAGALTNSPFLKGIAPLNLSELSVTFGEIQDKEAAEPGTHGGEGGEPTPVPQDLQAPPPPWNPEVMPEDNVKHKEKDMDPELLKLIGLSEDADPEAVKARFSVLVQSEETLKAADAEAVKAISFKEQFPDEYEVQQKLLAKARKSDAKEFADSFKHSEKGYSFPPAVRDQIAVLHEKVASSTLTENDLSEVLQKVLDTGRVPTGEQGNNGSGEAEPTGTSSDSLIGFRERISELRAGEGKLSFTDAVEKAAGEMPEAYQEYRKNRDRIPAGSTVKNGEVK